MPDIARQENNDLTRKYFNLRFAKSEDICKDSKLEEKYTPCKKTKSSDLKSYSVWRTKK